MLNNRRGVAILDAGAIILASRGSRPVRQRITALRDLDFEMYVPAAVIAETVRGNGPRDAPVNIVVNSTDGVLSLHETTARHAGRLLADAGSNATLDALVVAHAIELRPTVILTTDPTDLAQLLGSHVGVTIESW